MNFTFEPTTIAIIILAIAVVVLFITLIRINARLNKFLIDSKAENLDDSLVSIKNALDLSDKFQKEMADYLTTVEKRLKKSVQATHTVRFNPFKGTGSGGNQSFATAFLNEDGHGVVISSLYSREHVSVFSKPIKAGNSDYELSLEEREAVKEALKLIR